jgi:hypothetical protein
MAKDTKEFWTLVITMVIGGLAYSIVAFAYMQSSFVPRSEMEVLYRRLDRFEQKIDTLIERGR